MGIKKTQWASFINTTRATLFHIDIANFCTEVAYWLCDFCFLVFLFFFSVISRQDSLPSQLWRIVNCLAGRNAWSLQLCLCVSVLFVRAQASVSERLTGFFFLSVPGSAPGWLHRAPLPIALLSDKRAVRTVPAVLVKLVWTCKKSNMEEK